MWCLAPFSGHLVSCLWSQSTGSLTSILAQLVNKFFPHDEAEMTSSGWYSLSVVFFMTCLPFNLVSGFAGLFGLLCALQLLDSTPHFTWCDRLCCLKWRRHTERLQSISEELCAVCPVRFWFFFTRSAMFFDMLLCSTGLKVSHLSGRLFCSVPEVVPKEAAMCF